MLGDEGALLELRSQPRTTLRERQPERRHVRAERVFRLTGVFGDELRHRRFNAPVDNVFPIDPRPAVLRPDRHVREIVGHQIGAKHVAFVDRGPQLARPRAPRQPIGIA